MAFAMSLRWSGLVALLGWLSSACAQSHDGHPDIATRSGLRLRLRWLESEGVRVPLGWHDAQLGVDCTVQRAGDGELYCFPGAMTAKLFVDAQCAESVAATGICAANPFTQATVSSSPSLLGATGSCPFAELYTAQAAEPLSTYFVQLSATSCVENPFGSFGAFTPRRLLERVPESTLVHVTEVKTVGQDQLQNRYYAGDDGSYLPIGFVDARFGACDPGVAADGRTRCLPRTGAALDPDTFADPACSIPAAITIASCEAQQETLSVSIEPNTREGGCTSLRRYFELGEPIAQAFGGSACGTHVFSPANVVHRVGAELDPATFPLLDPAEIGSGRLRLQGWSAHGLEPFFGLESRLAGFSDVQLALSCSATTTTDGALRCAPTASGFAYPDATCTRPYVYRSGCEPHAAPQFARSASDACRVSVHAVAHEPEPLLTPFARSGSICGQLGNGAASGYALQEVADPALFAPMSERVE